MTHPTRALSIRAPWWWMILHAGKDIENRSRWTSFRGPVLIHASSYSAKGPIMEDLQFGAAIAHQAGIRPPAESLDENGKLTLRRLFTSGGCIVGTVDIVDCRTISTSPWFFGPYGYALANPRPLATPIPCKGALGLFQPSADVLAQVYAQIDAMSSGEAA